jgi:hypothetical protein
VGSSTIDDGAGCGVNVTCAGVLAPFQLAVTVAVVFAVTLLVGSGNDTEKSPGFTNTDDGGVTAAELLDKVTDAPPAGACPVSMTSPPACAPPLMVVGVIVNDFNAVGVTFNEPEAEPPFSVAVMVIGVDDATCPACIMNCVHARFAGIVIVAGTGAAVGFELVRLMTVSLAGAPVSCSCTHVELPLVSGLVVNDTETGLGGAEPTVKLRVADHGVTAAVVGDASPCTEWTRQYFTPGVSDNTVRDGLFS